MRKTSAFRPLVLDWLEDRLVLSHLGKPSTAAAAPRRRRRRRSPPTR